VAAAVAFTDPTANSINFVSTSKRGMTYMDKLDPLRAIGMPVDTFSAPLKNALEDLTPEEINVLARIQKKAVDAGVGTVTPTPGLGGGGSGSCLY
jgi:hypothetical protein